jgi:RNA polymerase sigma-70 factor (ECF subfamily)
MAPPASEPPSGFTLRLIAQIPRLRRYATAWLHNAADADDLVQDCIERALLRHDSLRDPDRLGGWLLAILHNMHLSNLRRTRRLGQPLAVDSLADDLALSAPPEDRGEIRSFVRAMETLSEDHRQILLLVGLEGLSYREIAELLEVPIGTVMSRLARARERLRIALEGGDDQTLRSVR